MRSPIVFRLSNQSRRALRQVTAVFVVALFSAPYTQSAQAQLFSAVLPNEVAPLGFSERAPIRENFFATLINAGTSLLQNCRIEMATDLPLILDYQVTEPVRNESIGPANRPAAIAPGAAQTYRFSLRLREDAVITRQDVGFRFTCDGITPAPVVDGINTVSLSAGEASPPPAPLLSAIAVGSPDGALLFNDQPGGQPCRFVPYPGAGETSCAIGAYAFALINNGSQPLSLDVFDSSTATFSQLCRTDAVAGCSDPAPPWESVALTLDPAESATFSVFLLTTDDFAFDDFDSNNGVGFEVFAALPEGAAPDQRELLAAGRAPSTAAPFEWSARLAGNSVIVDGSLWVENGCNRASLTPVFDSSLPDEELHLDLGPTTSHLPPDFDVNVECTQAAVKVAARYQSEGAVNGITTVVVRDGDERVRIAIDGLPQ